MSTSSSHHYAVFLCHNSKDKPIVRIIHQSLRQEYDLPTYIDESDLVSGEEWEKSIQAALSRSKTCAILIGGNGWGGYQLEGEAKPALARMAKDPAFRVIPVLLPDANPEALLDLREFFQRTHWVDFRSNGERAAIRALASAVRGENPFPEGRPELTPMRVSFDSIRWDVSKRLDASVLYEGQQLREAWALRAERPADFDDLAVAFLSASEHRQNEELGRGLAAHAAALVNNPSQAELAANLALEAMQRFPTPQAHAVLSLVRTRLPMVTAQFEHPAPVNAVAMNPAETWMATGCQDGGVAFRDEHQFMMAGSKHSASVRAAVFDPDNAWLATGDNDGSVVIWDLERREPRSTLSLGDAVTKLEVRAGRDGSLLLASSGHPGHPGNVSVWSAAEWKQLWTGSMITDATFDASGAHVVLAWGDHVVTRDALSGELTGKCALDTNVMAVAAHPKNSLIAATTFSRQIWIGRIEQEKAEMRPVNNRISPVTRIRFSPDGRWLAAVGDDFYIRVWDPDTELLHVYPYSGLIGIEIGFSPNGTFLSVISPEDKSITLWHLMSRQMLCTLEYDKPSCVLFSNDERMVIAASAGTTAEMLELPSQDDAFWSIGLGVTLLLTFSADGRRLAWIGFPFNPDMSIGRPKLIVLRVDHCEVELSVQLPESDALETTRVVFKPEGREIAVYFGTAVRIWDLESRTELNITESPGWINYPADKTVSPLPQLRRMTEACEQRGRVSTIVSPDEKWLAIDHGKQLLSVWNAPADTELFSSSMGGEVSVMAFSPASGLFAAGDARGGISIWSTSGTPLAQFRHNEPIMKLCFSPDETVLAAGSADSAVRLWLVAPEILAAQVRPRLRRSLSREEWVRYLGDEPYPAKMQSAVPQKS